MTLDGLTDINLSDGKLNVFYIAVTTSNVAGIAYISIVLQARTCLSSQQYKVNHQYKAKSVL